MMTMIHDSSGGENKVLQYFIIKKTDKIKNFYATKHNGQMFVVKQKKRFGQNNEEEGGTNKLQPVRTLQECSISFTQFHGWHTHKQTDVEIKSQGKSH